VVVRSCHALGTPLAADPSPIAEKSRLGVGPRARRRARTAAL